MKYWAAWIIINSKKQILLLKRSDYTKSFPHHWWIPWWRCDEWELPEDWVIREILEETGLTFTPTSLFQSGIINRTEWQLKTHRFLWSWSWKIFIQEEEAEGYGRFTYNEAIQLPLSFDYSDVIEQLHEKWLI